MQEIFKKAEGIPMVEEVGWKLVELHGAVGSMVIDG